MVKVFNISYVFWLTFPRDILFSLSLFQAVYVKHWFQASLRSTSDSISNYWKRSQNPESHLDVALSRRTQNIFASA